MSKILCFWKKYLLPRNPPLLEKVVVDYNNQMVSFLDMLSSLLLSNPLNNKRKRMGLICYLLLLSKE